MTQNDNKSQSLYCSVSNDCDVCGCGRLDLDRELRGAVRRSRRGRGLLLVALALSGLLFRICASERQNRSTVARSRAVEENPTTRATALLSTRGAASVLRFSRLLTG